MYTGKGRQEIGFGHACASSRVSSAIGDEAARVRCDQRVHIQSSDVSLFSVRSTLNRPSKNNQVQHFSILKYLLFFNHITFQFYWLI